MATCICVTYPPPTPNISVFLRKKKLDIESLPGYAANCFSGFYAYGCTRSDVVFPVLDVVVTRLCRVPMHDFGDGDEILSSG